MAEAQELTVLFLVSKHAPHDEDVLRDKVFAAASRMGTVVGDVVGFEAAYQGTVDLGTPDEPYKIDLAERGLVLYTARLMAIPHEGSDAPLP